MKTSALVASVVVALVSLPTLHDDGRNADAKKLPPAAQGKIDFVKDIQPILERSCIRCHSTPEAVATTNFARNKGGLSLSTREESLRSGGVIGTIIIPGKSAQSPLVHLVSGHPIGEVRAMPPQEAARLTGEEVGKFRAWIDQGAVWPKEVVLGPHGKKGQ